MNLEKAKAPLAVIGIGWVMHDSILLVPKYPAEDTKTEALKEVDQVGGPVARALSVISSLGFETAVSAVLGADESGLVCSHVLNVRGVLTEGLQVVEGGQTRRSQVWVSSRNASRTTVYSNSALPSLDNLSNLMAAAESSEILHLDGRELQVAVPVASNMRRLGKTVVVDAGGWKANLESLLRYTDILIVSLTTLKGIAIGDLAAKAKRLRDEHGLRSVVVTDGTRGAWVLENDALCHVPASVVQPVDTHGAGDAFAGGLIYGLLKGWALLESVRFGSGVAALGCEHFGDFFPSVEDVVELLAKGGRL